MGMPLSVPWVWWGENGLFIGEGKEDDKINSWQRGYKLMLGKGIAVICTLMGWTWSSSDMGIFWLPSGEEPAGAWGNWCFGRNSCLSASVGRKSSSLLPTHKTQNCNPVAGATIMRQRGTRLSQFWLVPQEFDNGTVPTNARRENTSQQQGDPHLTIGLGEGILIFIYLSNY